LTIKYLETVESTQIYLKNLVKKKSISLPYAVCANMQTKGQGSRENKWEGISGNLFLSFALKIETLPKDLKLESASIYFSYILKSTLQEFGSSVWLKWPNDFYVGEKKIGGMITNVVNDVLVCGVGINIVKAPLGYAKLDVSVVLEEMLNIFFKNVEKRASWKQVFSKYKLEFYKSKNFSTHNNSLKYSLQSAILQTDGSITINDERIYSLR